MKAGMYWMESPRAGLGETENGKQYFFLEGQITHRYENGQPFPIETPVTRTIQLWMTTDKAIQNTNAKLLRIGWNKDLESPSFSFTGNEDGLEVECRLETYEGKEREKWELPGIGSGFDHKQVGEAKKRELQAKIAALNGLPMAATPPPARTGPPVKAAAAPPDPDDFNF